METPLSKSVNIKLAARFEPEIYIPKPFPEKNKEGEIVDGMWMFRADELRYLDALHRGEDAEKALRDAGLDIVKAGRLLKRKKAREYMGQLLRQKMAAEGMTQEWFLNELKGVWHGTKKADRQQMDAIKEIGARVAPRPERSSQDFERPVININVGLAEAAIKRQEIIEGQLVDGSKLSR